MTFGLMLATVLLITHVKQQRNRMCQKFAVKQTYCEHDYVPRY